jgi:hypothetical protein
MGGVFLGIGVRACAIDAYACILGFALAELPQPRVDENAIDQQPEIWW